MIPEPLSVGEITLRPWWEDEARRYMSLRDEEIFRFTTESEEAGAVDCEAIIGDARTDPRRATLAVCGPSGTPVGNVSIRRSRDHVEVSYWLGADARGRGWASTSLRATVDWIGSVWGEVEVWLEIDPDNQASIHVAEASGFRPGGMRLESACGGPALVYRRRSGRETSG